MVTSDLYQISGAEYGQNQNWRQIGVVWHEQDGIWGTSVQSVKAPAYSIAEVTKSSLQAYKLACFLRSYTAYESSSTEDGASRKEK